MTVGLTYLYSLEFPRCCVSLLHGGGRAYGPTKGQGRETIWKELRWVIPISMEMLVVMTCDGGV